MQNAVESTETSVSKGSQIEQAAQTGQAQVQSAERPAEQVPQLPQSSVTTVYDMTKGPQRLQIENEVIERLKSELECANLQQTLQAEENLKKQDTFRKECEIKLALSLSQAEADKNRLLTQVALAQRQAQ